MLLRRAIPLKYPVTSARVVKVKVSMVPVTARARVYVCMCACVCMGGGVVTLMAMLAVAILIHKLSFPKHTSTLSNDTNVLFRCAFGLARGSDVHS